MIISRTPLRMSFVGGGSDLPAYFRTSIGAVVSTAVDKYVYITVNKKFDSHIRVSYSETEEVTSVHEIKHALVRESLKKLGIPGGIEITSIADIPSRGTGLGSSSAFTVGLLHALYAYRGEYSSADRLARQSCEIEIEQCGEPIGKQDQYAAAFGGFNFIQFYTDGSVSVEPIICRRETVQQLQKNLLVFYTGMTRRASSILLRKQQEIRTRLAKQAIVKRMVDLAFQLRAELQRDNLDAFGEILHANWQLKKSLTDGVSNRCIDTWYNRARHCGALGGKLLGAGSGGFLLFYAPQQKHDRIKKVLSSLQHVNMRFEPQGSRIIFVHD